jgi:hypothetical protein
MDAPTFIKVNGHKFRTEKVVKNKIKQGQHKAWCIPSPKNLTFDLENQ